MSCRWKISVIGEVVAVVNDGDLDLKVDVEEDERRRGVDEEELDVAYIGNREYSPRDMAFAHGEALGSLELVFRRPINLRVRRQRSPGGCIEIFQRGISLPYCRV